MTKPRLLVLASTFPARPGDGTPAFVRDLALEEAAEYDVTVLVPRVPGAASTEQDEALEIVRYAYFPRRWEALADGAILDNLRARRALWLQVPTLLAAQTIATWRTVRRVRPDVMHVHWIIPQGIVARLVAPRVPQLVTTLGGDLYALTGGLARGLKSWVVRNAAAVTVMNADMRERVIELGGRAASTLVEPMGADVAAIRREVRRVDTGSSTRLLFVGRLVEKKGLAVLLRAIGTMDIPGLTLHIVGDGPLRAELEDQARDLPVVFLGQRGRSELAQEYAAADVVVAPSVVAASGDQDGLPVALIEAMAAGCAVVVSDLPGLAEIASDGAGVVVPSGDVTALAAALEALAADPARLAGLGKAASERADTLSVPSVGARYRQILQRVRSGVWARTR